MDADIDDDDNCRHCFDSWIIIFKKSVENKINRHEY